MKEIKLLVVDDNESVLYAVKRGLENLGSGYIISTANGGRACLKAAAKGPPDLILLDLMMPDMDGWEVYAKLKKEKKTKSIPIIFLTALGESENHIVKLFDKLVKGTKDLKKLTHVEITKDTYIQKPFKIEEMDKKIRKMVRKSTISNASKTGGSSTCQKTK